MRMSFMPASPMNNAYRDHSQAASVPTEMSVSIVAAPCLRFAHAAWWKGHAAHSTTGVTRVSESHWKLSNWRAGIIAISRAGSESRAATIRRRRRGAVASSSLAAAAARGRARRLLGGGRRGAVGQGRGVARRLDLLDEPLGLDRVRVELDPRLL